LSWLTEGWYWCTASVPKLKDGNVRWIWWWTKFSRRSGTGTFKPKPIEAPDVVCACEPNRIPDAIEGGAGWAGFTSFPPNPPIQELLLPQMRQIL
jgi:hypothetical protein